MDAEEIERATVKVEVCGRDQRNIIKYVYEDTEEDTEEKEGIMAAKEEGSITEGREENMAEEREENIEEENTGVERERNTEEKDQKGIPKRRMKTARKGFIIHGFVP